MKVLYLNMFFRLGNLFKALDIVQLLVPAPSMWIEYHCSASENGDQIRTVLEQTSEGRFEEEED